MTGEGSGGLQVCPLSLKYGYFMEYLYVSWCLNLCVKEEIWAITPARMLTKKDVERLFWKSLLKQNRYHYRGNISIQILLNWWNIIERKSFSKMRAVWISFLPKGVLEATEPVILIHKHLELSKWSYLKCDLDFVCLCIYTNAHLYTWLK